MIRIIFLIILSGAAAQLRAQMAVPSHSKAAPSKTQGMPTDDYAIKRPGEITFTTGVVIEGRVEKPQVVLVLSKEKIKLNPIDFKHDLLGNVTRPLNVIPFELFSEKEVKGEKKGL